MALNTLEFFETLKEAGVPEKQARAFSTVICKSHDAACYAAKTSVQDIEIAIRHDMGKMDTDIRNEIEKTKFGLQHSMEKLEANLRYEINDLRKDMDAGFYKMNAKFDKMGLQLTVRLGVMIPALVTVLPYIGKVLHLPLF